MRGPWVRTVVTILFVTLYVASSTVSALGTCCHSQDAANGPMMECCKEEL
jgi:hypothetical protein